MKRKSVVRGLALGCVIALGSGRADAKTIPPRGPTAVLVATGLEGGGAIQLMLSAGSCYAEPCTGFGRNGGQ